MYITLHPTELQPHLRALAERAVTAIAEVSGLQPDDYGGIDAEAEVYDNDSSAVRAILDVIDLLVDGRPVSGSLRDVLVDAVNLLS